MRIYFGNKKERNNQAFKKYYQKNKAKMKKKTIEWIKKNPDKVKKYQFISSKKEQRKKMSNLRNKTRYRQGKLKKGFEYHHPKPYDADKFMILESKFHKFYHNNPTLFNIGGKL